MKKYDILTQTQTVSNIKSLNGELKSFKNSEFTKKALRKFEDNKIYYFSFFGDVDDNSLINQAKVIPDVGIPFSYQLNDWKSQVFNDQRSLQLKLELLEDEASDIEKKLRIFTNDFAISGVYDRVLNKIEIVDNEKNKLEAISIHNTNWYAYTRLGSGSIMDGFFWNASLNMNPDYIKECLHLGLDHFDKKAQIENGQYPVLFVDKNEAEDSFLRKIKDSLMADKYFQKSGLLTDKLNHRVFNEKLTVFDTTSDTSSGIFNPFDFEGYIRKERNLNIVENGVVKNVIADLNQSSKYNILQTGNSIRDFKSTTITNYNSLIIKPGLKSTEEILKSLPACILVFLGGGSDFSDLGDYSFPVQVSYLYEYGKPMGRLESLSLNANVFEMFGDNLIEIASNNFYKSEASPSVFMKMNVMMN